MLIQHIAFLNLTVFSSKMCVSNSKSWFPGQQKNQKKILVEKGGCHPSSVRKLEASCIKCKPRRDNGRNTRKSVHRDQPAGFVTKSWVRMWESKFSWNSPPTIFIGYPLLPVNMLHVEILEDFKGLQDVKCIFFVFRTHAPPQFS